MYTICMAITQRKIALILVILMIAASVFFVLRGPYSSNFLKRIILSELENATGRQVTAQHMFVNIFPLYVEANGIKAFDKDGVRVAAIETAKGYIRPFGILGGRIAIERVVLKSPELWAERAHVEDVVEHYKKYGAGKKKSLIGVRVRAVVIKNGSFSYYDEKQNAVVTTKGIDTEILLKKEPELDFSVSEIEAALRKWPILKGQIKGSVLIKKDALNFKRLKVVSQGSSLESTGQFSKKGESRFSVTLSLLVDSIKKLLGLKKTGQGVIHASGNVAFNRKLTDTTLNLKVKGEFYLETLMEVLKADRKNELRGRVSFDGVAAGKLSDLAARAKARLEKGSLFGILIDELSCRVEYGKNILSFLDGTGALYGGSGRLEAAITLPSVRPYSLEVAFSGVDSPPALKLVKLSSLGLPFGKVGGELKTQGMQFNPEGRVFFETTRASDDPLGRIKTIKGNFSLKDNAVALHGFQVRTGLSRIPFDGRVDLSEGTMEIDGGLKTENVRDLTAPYFSKLTGKGESSWRLRGRFDDPLVEGPLTISGASVDGLALGVISGDVSYRKSLLLVNTISAEKNISELSGAVQFPEARHIFDLREPDYDLAASLKSADLSGILKIFNLNVPLDGVVDSDITVRGRGPRVEGPVSLTEGSIYGVPGISAKLGLSYEGGTLRIKDADLKKEDSSLLLDGEISTGGNFAFRALSEKLFLRHVLPESVPVDYALRIDAEGRGTLKNPEISTVIRMSEGKLKGENIGDGSLKASLKDRTAVVEANILDDSTSIRGRASLEGDIPWSAEAKFRRGRYDALLRAFLAEPPDDLLLSITGTAEFAGDKKHLTARANLERMHFNLFGQGFTNEKDMAISFLNGTFHVAELLLRSGDAVFGLSGSFKPGANLDVTLNGSMSLSPFKTFSKKIDVLKGDADFVFSLEGDWEKPVVSGGVEISRASFAIKDFPQRFTSINGYIYVDQNRVVVQRLRADSGGGNVELTGLIHAEGFRLRKFYIDALVDNVTAYVSKDFSANLGGNILFRGSPESGYITGEVRINRARYRERLEWKSWLLTERREKAPRTERGWVDSIGLNLRLYGDEDIYVDNNIANAPLKIDMTLQGTVGSPVLLGRMEAAEGRVYFRNRKFRILRATADFTDPLKGPYIDIFAETSVKGYHIWLNLEGRTEQFDLALTSDPSIDEVQILSLLTLGEFGENLKGLEGGVGAAEATAFLTGKFQDVMEERLTDITGLSRVQIAPYVSKTTGTVTPKLTVSKTLMDDRLSVSYSTTVGVASDEVEMEYSLGKNTSIVGERDERGSMGGDIKFRFQFK